MPSEEGEGRANDAQGQGFEKEINWGSKKRKEEKALTTKGGRRKEPARILLHTEKNRTKAWGRAEDGKAKQYEQSKQIERGNARRCLIERAVVSGESPCQKNKVRVYRDNQGSEVLHGTGDATEFHHGKMQRFRKHAPQKK